ncbi:MAG: hypothetical protein Q8904_06380 [Bacteroidota bacterium]|nr:hypothetical protein [Bacteroidota bacterium]
MIRIGSQLTFCSPEKILRRAAVEQDGQNFITNFFSLDDGIVEPAHTLFYDGILSAEIVSVKQSADISQISNLLMDYRFLDLSESIPPGEIGRTDKPLVIDIGTTSADKFNPLLPHLALALSAYSIFEIIAACTYYPALLLGRTAGLAVGRRSRLLLWEHADLIKKELTPDTRVREMN